MIVLLNKGVLKGALDQTEELESRSRGTKRAKKQKQRIGKKRERSGELKK